MIIIDRQRYLEEKHHLTISINKVICQIRDPIKLIIKPGLQENGINEPHPHPVDFSHHRNIWKNWLSACRMSLSIWSSFYGLRHVWRKITYFIQIIYTRFFKLLKRLTTFYPLISSVVLIPNKWKVLFAPQLAGSVLNSKWHSPPNNRLAKEINFRPFFGIL